VLGGAVKRGFLIQSLLLIALLLVFCLGLLGRQPFAYSGAKQTSKMLQARQLAVAGMEDVRVKLERDYQTRQLGEVKTVSYVEDVVSGSELVGSYHVTINQELQDATKPHKPD
jgi:type II secretory pathway component PulK